jgi:hypothetical protein
LEKQQERSLVVDQFYLIRAQQLGLSWKFLEKIQECFQGRNLIFISFCPVRRQEAEALGITWVLNPFKWYLWGEVEAPVIWWDQWPSFAANQYEPLRQHFRGTQGIHYFYQSFSLKKEKLIFEQAFGDWQLLQGLYKEKVPIIPIVSNPLLILKRYEGEERRGLILKDPRRWLNESGKELFIPFCLWRHSSCLALAGRHRILLVAAVPLKSWRHWCLWETVLAWLLSGQLQPDLLGWWSENKNRGNPHAKDSFSGKARHWHASIKEWSLSLCTILWRTRWWKEA